MNLFVLSWNYIKSKPLNMALNILLMSLGIAIIMVLILLNVQLEDSLGKNKRGIDLVVGAKGAPAVDPLPMFITLIFPLEISSWMKRKN